MTYHVRMRHPVPFGARTTGKSESVYYNLQFWLFLGHFWAPPGVVIFSLEPFIGKPTWLVTLQGCLTQFACLEKPLNIPFGHFLWNLKLPQNERKGIHIFVPSHITHYQWPPMSLGDISWRSELGPRESSKACIITFKFDCFRDIFYFFGLGHILSRNIPRIADVTCIIAQVLGTIFIASKSLRHPFVHFSWNPKLARNERKGIHIFIPSDMTPFQWSLMSLWGILWRSKLGSWESPKACIITFNFGCFWDIFGIPWAWPFFLLKRY